MVYRLNNHKYKAVRCEADGIKFDSKAERDYYLTVKSDPSIEVLECQPKIYLTRARILYKPDFLIMHSGRKIWVDVKGMETSVFRIKRRLWIQYGPGPLQIIKKKGKRFYISEEVNTLGDVPK